MMKQLTFPKHWLVWLGSMMGLFASSCGSTSDVLVAPRQDVTVRGDENEAFKVTAINDGRVPLIVLERLEYGESINLGLLSIGERRQLKFLAGSAAVFANPSQTDTARLTLRLRGAARPEAGGEPR